MKIGELYKDIKGKTRMDVINFLGNEKVINLDGDLIFTFYSIGIFRIKIYIGFNNEGFITLR